MPKAKIANVYKRISILVEAIRVNIGDTVLPLLFYGMI